MTTIKLKFRASTVEGRPGTLYYQLCRHGATKRINTRMHIHPGQWNSSENRLSPEGGNLEILLNYQQIINKDISLLQNIINRMEAFGADYTLSDIVGQYQANTSGTYSLAYIEEDIRNLILDGKFGTARNRRRTLSSFSAYLNGQDLFISDWNSSLIGGYAQWLHRKSLSRNTISFYMRNLRAIYNKAVKEGLATQHHPFQNVYTGVDRTRKRAVDEGVILKLMQLDLNATPALELARDIFIFSYCTRGMAFVDIAFLHKDNIIGSRIAYCRRKTGQRLYVHIEPCTAFILKKYFHAIPESPYVFPVIRSENEKDAYTQYQTALGYYNRNLKRLSRHLQLDTPLSSYVARHTWATTARNHNTPLAVISSGMGHTSEKTTRIYLAALDETVIDQANSSILAPLNSISGFTGC